MKLIIDIPEEVYKKAKETHDVMCDKVWLGIKYGTPLDNVKAEISRKANSGQWSEAVVYGMTKAVAIIDSIGKIESVSEKEKRNRDVITDIVRDR